MPVVSVTVPSDLAIDRAALLSAINAAVARALALTKDDVHSQLSLAVAGGTGESAVTPWPIAILHGRCRDAIMMSTAEQNVVTVLAGFTGRDREEVWVQWMVKE